LFQAIGLASFFFILKTKRINHGFANTGRWSHFLASFRFSAAGIFTLQVCLEADTEFVEGTRNVHTKRTGCSG
jgi:hypothetical protein